MWTRLMGTSMVRWPWRTLTARTRRRSTDRTRRPTPSTLCASFQTYHRPNTQVCFHHPHLFFLKSKKALTLTAWKYFLLIVDSSISREYAVPDLSKCGPPPPVVPSCVPLIPRPPAVTKLPLDQHYAATDVVKVPSIQGVSGNTVYAVPSTPDWLSTRDKLDIREYPREQLHFLEKLGEGQFGEVSWLSYHWSSYFKYVSLVSYFQVYERIFEFVTSLNIFAFVVVMYPWV